MEGRNLGEEYARVLSFRWLDCLRLSIWNVHFCPSCHCSAIAAKIFVKETFESRRNFGERGNSTETAFSGIHLVLQPCLTPTSHHFIYLYNVLIVMKTKNSEGNDTEPAVNPGARRHKNGENSRMAKSSTVALLTWGSIQTAVTSLLDCIMDICTVS